MKPARSALATLGLAMYAAACSNAPLGSSLSNEQEGIVRGMGSSDADNAVVDVLNPQNNCSGTLIAPNVVLTAMHCVVEFDAAARFTCNPDGSLQTDTPGNGQFGPQLDPSVLSIGVGIVADFTAHGKTIFDSGAATACKNDIAVIVLDRDIDIGAAPLVTLRFGRTTQKGELTRVLGYGNTVFEADVPGRQERDDVKVLDVGDLSPTMPGNPQIIPHSMVAGEGSCKGDSGGPMFSQETGAQIGVYSLLLSQTCVGFDVRNTYTQVAAFEPLIRRALEAGGHDPLVEPAPSTGSGGDAGASAQGGEGNTVAEGGASSAVGGGANSAGGAVAAGSGGTGANSTAGQGAVANDQGEGSGSRRDPSCTCRASRDANYASPGLLAFFGALLILGFRKHRS
jgi:hypothetical protein